LDFFRQSNTLYTLFKLDAQTRLDEIPEGLLFASLALLLCLSAFFSASETATMAINRYRLADKASKNDKKAILLQKLISQPDRLLGTILLGNNLVNNAAVAIATMLAWKYYGESGVAISTAIITILILVIAEVPPKTVAAIYPNRIAFFAAYVLEFLQKVFHPAVWLLSLITKKLKKFAGFHHEATTHHVLDVDELRVALKASEQNLAPQQMEMLLGIIELGTNSIDSIMVPRTEIHAIDINDELPDIIEQIKKEEFSRVLVYEKQFDNIKGELDIQQFLQSTFGRELTKEIILNSLKEPIYLFEDSMVSEQIQRLQLENRNLGIIVDEYGTVVGLVTLNEIMEELAGIVGGQIPGVNPGIFEETESGSYLVNAKMNLRDMNRIMQWDLPTEGPNTLNGQILELFQDIPSVGTTFQLNGYTVETIRVNAKAVVIARVYPAKSQSPSGTGGDKPTQQPESNTQISP